MEPTIDIIVVNYKTYPVLQTFLNSYSHFKPQTSSRIIIVDNESDKEQFDNISKPENSICLESDDNLGYAKACNYGASIGDSKYIALMNSDVEFVNNTCIDICVEFLEDNPDVGIVGPFQYCEDRNNKKLVTHAGIVGPGDKPVQRNWKSSSVNKYRNNEEVLMVIGAVMIIRREAWDAMRSDPTFKKHWPDAVGAMPEHKLYYEDTALCYAMPYFGYKVYYIGEAEIIHQWHKTISKYGDGGYFHKSRESFRNLMDDWGILHD